jgi:hypothetical protein
LLKNRAIGSKDAGNLPHYNALSIDKNNVSRIMINRIREILKFQNRKLLDLYIEEKNFAVILKLANQIIKLVQEVFLQNQLNL